jgi:hypothetical protein
MFPGNPEKRLLIEREIRERRMKGIVLHEEATDGEGWRSRLSLIKIDKERNQNR